MRYLAGILKSHQPKTVGTNSYVHSHCRASRGYTCIRFPAASRIHALHEMKRSRRMKGIDSLVLVYDSRITIQPKNHRSKNHVLVDYLGHVRECGTSAVGIAARR